MSKVFVIMDVPGKNLLPAKEYGDLRVILHGKENNVTAYSKLDQVLSVEFSEKDFLLLIGNPIFIAMASSILTEYHPIGKIQFLVWDRQQYKYNVERITDGQSIPATRQ